MRITSRVRAILLVGAIALGAAVFPRPVSLTAADSAARGGSIHQLVEVRAQGRRCSGVVINLASLAFKPSIAPEQLDIRDDRHDADLRSVMRWHVSTDGRQLTIRLEGESTDFGSGNALRVCLQRTAFLQGSQPAHDRLCWMIGTDLL